MADPGKRVLCVPRGGHVAIPAKHRRGLDRQSRKFIGQFQIRCTWFTWPPYGPSMWREIDIQAVCGYPVKRALMRTRR
jgi:hypothetical protein